MSVAVVVDCDFMYDKITTEIKSCDHGWKKDDKFCSDCGVKTYSRITKERKMKKEYENWINTYKHYFGSLKTYTFLGQVCDILMQDSIYLYAVFKLSPYREVLEEDGIFDENDEIDFNKLKEALEVEKDNLVEKGIPRKSVSIKMVDYYGHPI